MKTIYLFIMFVFICVVPATGQPNDFSEVFINSIQKPYHNDFLKENEELLLNKNLDIELKNIHHELTTNFHQIIQNNTKEIINSILKTENELLRNLSKREKENTYLNLYSFSYRYAKKYPHEISVANYNYLNNTNNWFLSTDCSLISLLAGSEKAFGNMSDDLFDKYFLLYKKICDTKEDGLLFKELKNCIQEKFKKTPLPKLEEMLQKETNTSVMYVLLSGVSRQPSDKAYEIYAKYHPIYDRKMTPNANIEFEIREDLFLFKQKCIKYENWNKRLKAADYDIQKAEKHFKAEVDAMDIMLKSIPLNNPKEILKLPELLHQAEDLAGEKPQSGMYPDRYLNPIKRNPVPECKEAYWQILQREPDEDKYKIEPKISVAFGEAYGKVMTKEDVPKVIDYMNKQRSLKLLMLMENVLGKGPKKYKKNGTMGIIEGIRRSDRKEILQEFYKNKDKVKDIFMRKCFIEMAEKNGLVN